MKDISIFAKPASYKRRSNLPYRHLFRGSSMIRGNQIAEYLGCKLNPIEGYENDICIYIKPTTLDHIKDGDWVDIVDGDHIVTWLKDRPLINTIVNGETSYNIYRPHIKNKMVVIHPHHCNFDRELRARKEITTVGYIGGEIVFCYSLEEMRKQIENIGLNFIYSCGYETRQDVVDFYKHIDIQIVWSHHKFRYQSRGPTKFVNAASFGIPTVGYPQVCCNEVEGNYIKANTISELFMELDKLKDPYYHEAWAKKIDWTEKYHISKRAALYRQLEFA